ncbi:hypothetical protein PVAP13_6NG091212 [Panicum virgatum]|uniref:Uncharacterized protein n=1 Tax=Panicum virgatum TaxID=38727 RepID=A0A8T0QWG4_PANVG|nr:hypothetical protein PVAP13_6NG091212 [Panicum virgatum]
MIPIVASGKESPVKLTYERSAIEACLLELENYGYLIPNLSWFKIKALQQNQHDIVSLCETLSRENLYDIDIFGNTFTAISLEEILCQAVEQLGYYVTELGPVYTRGGLYQSSFKFRTTPDHTVEPMFTVYGKALPRRSNVGYEFVKSTISKCEFLRLYYILHVWL